MQLFLLVVGIFRILQSCVELCVGDGAWHVANREVRASRSLRPSVLGRCSHAFLLLLVLSFFIAVACINCFHRLHDFVIQVQDERLARCCLSDDIDDVAEPVTATVVVHEGAACQVCAEHRSCRQYATELHVVGEIAHSQCVWLVITEYLAQTLPPVGIVDGR